MNEPLDLTGEKFGRLIALEPIGYHYFPSGQRKQVWKCKCECGKITNTYANSLTSGNTQSCGCLRIENLVAKCSTHGATRHGKKERLYIVWNDIKDRCKNKNNPSYKFYGGNGISLCQEWNDYAVFREWAYKNGYDESAEFGKCTIDRINTLEGYSPENCRWISLTEQQSNRRSTRIIEYNGERNTCSIWANKIGISKSALCSRLNNGWSVEEALTIPKINCNRKYAKY